MDWTWNVGLISKIVAWELGMLFQLCNSICGYLLQLDLFLDVTCVYCLQLICIFFCVHVCYMSLSTLCSFVASKSNPLTRSTQMSMGQATWTAKMNDNQWYFMYNILNITNFAAWFCNNLTPSNSMCFLLGEDLPESNQSQNWMKGILTRRDLHCLKWNQSFLQKILQTNPWTKLFEYHWIDLRENRQETTIHFIGQQFHVH